jgi:dipeptidyl aminopeptidase/acylaminoacyl peptidase
VTWIWWGIGVYLSLPLTAAFLLTWLHFWLRIHYVPILVRIFQEVPLFNIPKGSARPGAEDVTLATRDGLTLRASYFKTVKPRRGVILFGLEFGSNRWSCGAYCEHLLDAGYDVFAYEPRNQGESDREPKLEPLHWPCDRDVTDAQAALGYLKARPDADPRGVGLFGISKGAGAGLLASVNDSSVRCAVTDGMFSCTYTVVGYMRKFITIYNKSYIIQGLLPSWYYASLARIGMRQVGRARGVQFLDLEFATGRFRRPLLMIHGECDTYIWPEMSRRLFGFARCPKEHWLVPRARHNEGPHIAPEEYRRRVREFFDQYLAST